MGEQKEDEHGAAVVVNGGDETEMVFDIEDRDRIAARDDDLVGRRKNTAQGDKVSEILALHQRRPMAEGWRRGRMERGVIPKAFERDEAHEGVVKVAILATFSRPILSMAHARRGRPSSSAWNSQSAAVARPSDGRGVDFDFQGLAEPTNHLAARGVGWL